MPQTSTTQKLYCFVDETGQDTEGRLFIVVAVVVASECHALRQYLEQAERHSGLGKRKWVRGKAAVTASRKYLTAINADNFKDNLFYSIYTDAGSGAYEQLLVLAVAHAVNLYREKHKIGSNYKVAVTIDGLKRSEEARVGLQLRKLGMRPEKVRGARDESESLLRLADRIAGLVRDSDTVGTSYRSVKRRMEKRDIISKL